MFSTNFAFGPTLTTGLSVAFDNVPDFAMIVSSVPQVSDNTLFIVSGVTNAFWIIRAITPSKNANTLPIINN